MKKSIVSLFVGIITLGSSAFAGDMADSKCYRIQPTLGQHDEHPDVAGANRVSIVNIRFPSVRFTAQFIVSQNNRGSKIGGQFRSQGTQMNGTEMPMWGIYRGNGGYLGPANLTLDTSRNKFISIKTNSRSYRLIEVESSECSLYSSPYVKPSRPAPSMNGFYSGINAI